MEPYVCKHKIDTSLCRELCCSNDRDPEHNKE